MEMIQKTMAHSVFSQNPCVLIVSIRRKYSGVDMSTAGFPSQAVMRMKQKQVILTSIQRDWIVSKYNMA